MRETDWRNKERELIAERRSVAFEDKTADTKAKSVANNQDSVEGSKPQNPDPKNLVGLSLSGGGIRSALYNDGFLQGLSHRGFLRFVDYLASVSGGGYIAGHLIAQARVSENKIDSPLSPSSVSKSSGFHDDDASPSSQQSQRWHLGRDPMTGKVDEKRLAGVGGYLSRPLEILPAFIWSCFFSTTFYIGVCGVLATLIALIWRSFDDPTFRIIYMDILHIRTGNELLIAFIPSLLLLFLTVALEVAFSLLSLCFAEKKRWFQRIHTSFRAVFLVLCTMSLVASCAIFLGNGTTNFRANSSTTLYLNNYAQWLAVIAGTLQVFVFFGSDKLFKSERQESKRWQKLLQRSLSVSVILFLCFAMIHWMGRENISGFVESRDPYLVVGDVDDWSSVRRIFSNFNGDLAKSKKEVPSWPTVPSELELHEALPIANSPESSWLRTLYGRRVAVLGNVDPNIELDPSIEAISRDGSAEYLGSRIVAAAQAYCLNTFFNRSSLKQDAPSNSMPDVLRKLVSLDKRRGDALKLWNNCLSRKEFTEWLAVSLSNEKRDSSKADLSIPDELNKLLDSKQSPLSTDEKNRIQSLLRREGLLTVNEWTGKIEDYSKVDRADYALVNRKLLEAAFPHVIKKMNVASTHVVPPYD